MIYKQPYLTSLGKKPLIDRMNVAPHLKHAQQSTSSVFLPDGLRFQHIYVPGKIGRGKSTLLHAMAYQDIQKGAGVTVIDPKGDLVNSLLQWIPKHRGLAPRIRIP